MAKTLTAPMQTHVASELTSLATCWQLTRKDGITIYVTDHDVDIVYDGNTYKASSGVSRSAIEDSSNMNVDNMELTGLIDNTVITDEDIRAGLYDDAEVRCFLVNHEDPDTYGDIKLRRGNLGEIIASTEIGSYKTDFRGLLGSYTQNILKTVQAECRVDLGSTECGIVLEADEIARETAYVVGDIVSVETDNGFTDGRRFEGRQYRCITSGTTAVSQPVYDTTIGNPTTDGTAEFECEYSFTQYVTIATVTSNRSFTISTPENDTIAVDNWFKYGRLVFQEGSNTAKPLQVKAYDSTTKQVDLYLTAPYAPEVGQLIKIQAGCGKSIDTYCFQKFNNAKRFRGEPFVPGAHQVARYPDAKS